MTTIAQLKKVAKELNEKMELTAEDCIATTKIKRPELEAQIVSASQLVEPEDEFSILVLETFKELNCTEALTVLVAKFNLESDEDEPEEEDDGPESDEDEPEAEEDCETPPAPPTRSKIIKPELLTLQSVSKQLHAENASDKKWIAQFCKMYVDGKNEIYEAFITTRVKYMQNHVLREEKKNNSK